MSARPQDLGQRLPTAFTRAAALSGAILLCILLAFLFIRDEHLRLVFSDVSAPLVDALVFVFLALAARKSFVRSRRLGWAWSAVAAAMLIYMLGDTSWGILEAGLNLAPFPSIADIFYLTYYLAWLAAVQLLIGRRQSRTQLTRDGLELAIVLT